MKVLRKKNDRTGFSNYRRMLLVEHAVEVLLELVPEPLSDHL